LSQRAAFILLNNQGTRATSGTFTQRPQGGTMTVNRMTSTISDIGGPNGNSVNTDVDGMIEVPGVRGLRVSRACRWP
jgi:hypothetical protein